MRGIGLKRKWFVLLFFILIAVFFSGCGIQKEKSKKLENFTIFTNGGTIALGQVKQLEVSLVPKDAEDVLFWSSSNEEIVDVKDGLITGKGVGTAVITARSASGIEKTVTITVCKKVSSVTLDKENVEMFVGDTMTLNVSIDPVDATYQDIRWKSDNPSVVEVKDGVITAKSTGIASVVVTVEGVPTKCTVSVKEKPLEFSGFGNKVITDVNVPYGEYVAHITIDSSRHHSVKFYYGKEKYEYELLVNDSGSAYSGTTLLKGGDCKSVIDGMFEIDADGPWTIKIEKLTSSEAFPIRGNGSQVTGVFEATSSREIFHIKINSSRYHSVKIYRYGGTSHDYDLLVNDYGSAYEGEVVAHTTPGSKYFFVVESKGDFEISRGGI